MVDFRGICPMVGSMKLMNGYKTLEEQEFFEWHHSEWDKMLSADISEEERRARAQELGDIFTLSTLQRERAGVAEHVGARYLKRIQDGRNYYSVKPFHWTSSTVK